MPAFEFLSYDELMVIAAVAMFLVVRNWWDWIRDSLDHPAGPAPVAPPLRRALRRLRRRIAVRSGRRHRSQLRHA